MASPPASPSQVLPWGRLVLLSRQKGAALPDHFDLSRSRHCIGRVAHRCDIHIPKQYISGLHCIIRMQGQDDQGQPIVQVEDHSRYGTWVNASKVGYRRHMLAKNGDTILFTPPGSKDVTELAYKLEILSNGLTQQNQDLKGKLSDEESVARRTLKRSHEETQATQSPSKAMRSPPRPRPAKKIRRVVSTQQSSQEEATEPVSEPASDLLDTPATQAETKNNSQAPSTRAAGKRRRRPDKPAPDSKLVKRQAERDQIEKERDDLKEERDALQKERDELKKERDKFRNERDELNKSVGWTTVKLMQATEELEALRQETTAMKKAHEEELKNVRDQAATELTSQAAHAMKNQDKLDRLRQERDVLDRTLNDILADPNIPHQVRTVVELEAKIQTLKQQFKAAQEDQALHSQLQDHSETTPPSKRQVVQNERMNQLGRQLRLMQEKRDIQLQEVQGLAEAEKKIADAIVSEQSMLLSGSSQSQDSIDSGHLPSRRHGNLSGASNEHSEPSPGDLSLTLDQESKSGDASQGLFNIYGAHNTSADTSNRPDTLSESKSYRPPTEVGQESKEQQGDVEEEETKTSE